MLPMTTTCHDSLISFEGLKGEQVALAVPFRSPFLAESRVRRTMRMARKLETPAMLSKSVCPTARAISIPTSHREAHGIKWSWNRNLDALVTECNHPVLLEIIKQVLWWYVHEYMCIYTHYDWLQVGILFKKLFDTMGCKINHLSWWMR